MSDFSAADGLADVFANLRVQVPQLVFADTFQIQASTPAKDAHGGYTESWSTVATARGLLTTRQITRGERLSADLVVTETVYQALLDADLDVTTANQLVHVGSGRVFDVTDVSTAEAAGVVLMATLKESSR